MNWVLIAVNVLIYLAQEFVGRSEGGPSWWEQYMLHPHAPRLLEFFSYAFLHGSPMHVAGNMLFLYIFGNNVNDKMGHVGYLGFYLAGGVASGIAYAATQNNPVPILGASGAVAAVSGAYLILFPRAHVTVLYLFILIGTMELASVWFILLHMAIDVFYMSEQMTRGAGTGVAHSAHLGGYLFGFAVCFAMLAGHLLPRDQFDVVALIKQWNRRRQYRDAVSAGWNPYAAGAAREGAGPGGGEPQPAPRPADARMARVMDLRGAISDAITAGDMPKAADLYIELKLADPAQVLSRQAQLDVANQLATQQRYPQAAEAYELFLRHYPKFEQIEQVELMLGLIYARYLGLYERARECLLKASARLHSENELEMARSELSRIAPLALGQQPKT
jgi:membrane associated rhomboid family serine protease